MHRVFLNERGLRAGWRLLIFAAILLVIGYAVGVSIDLLTSRARVQYGPTTLIVSPVWLALQELGQFSAIAISAWIMSLIEQRPVGTYGLPLTKTALLRFAAGFLLWGFLPLTAILLIMRLLGVFYFGGVVIQGPQILYWAAAWGMLFLAVGLVEEYLFRGYALYTLADGIGFWPAAIVLAVAFAGAHLGNGGEDRLGIIDIFIFGIFSAATLRRTGNLWLAVGAHAGWDWGESFFFGVNDSGFQAPGHLFNPHVQGPDWLSGGRVGPEGSVVDLIFWTFLTVSVFFFHRPRQRALPNGATTRPTNIPIAPSP